VQEKKNKVRVYVNEALSHAVQTVSSILHNDNPTRVPRVHLPQKRKTTLTPKRVS